MIYNKNFDVDMLSLSKDIDYIGNVLHMSMGFSLSLTPQVEENSELDLVNWTRIVLKVEATCISLP